MFYPEFCEPYYENCIVNIMDEGTLETPIPECRLYW
jgi:hypothetical protein